VPTSCKAICSWFVLILKAKNMKPLSRIYILIASIALLLIYVQPLWYIALEAPQYPDGIEMYIWVNKITGEEENTLQNINILNHYIGMKKIEPDSIPELKIFPYIGAVLILFGLLAWWRNKPSLLYAFGFTLLILSMLGVLDFWMWEYDYGHNLDPHAAIQVEGMTYQPPLLGSKWLLNFKAVSFPHIGGLALTLSAFLSLWAMVHQKWAKTTY
jgi:copper chaperone NosL